MTGAPRVALVGSPNSGKTTLFNALTGLRQRVANYPGVTVDHAVGTAHGRQGGAVTLIDLPGTYSLDALSADEAITTQALRGSLQGDDAPDGMIVVADATTLRRSMPLVLELLAFGIPAILVLTMVDELQARGGAVRFAHLRRRLGVPVIGVVGNKGIGLDDVRAELDRVSAWSAAPGVATAGEVDDVVSRFGRGDAILDECVTEPNGAETASDRADRWLLHPVTGLGTFALVMFLFFQAIFVVAAPVQDLFEGAVLWLGEISRALLPDGVLESLVVDGVIAGVGGVVVFVPQIAILLLLLRLMEGSGYMARAAFLIDRVMGAVGLEGRSFVALLSSYACAVPGIMATRTIPDPRSRLATILVAPLMTCSARLPVYALLISAFVPAVRLGGVVSVQGLVMLGLYLLGSLSALGAAALAHRLRRSRLGFPFYMELPPYRLPSLRSLLRETWHGVQAFLARAGTVILAASVVLWVLLNFPSVDTPAELLVAAPNAETAAAIDSAYRLEHSAAAAIGHAFEPAIRPLGFDWRIGVGILGSFAAREVIVATFAQLFAFGGDAEDLAGLGAKIANACAAGVPGAEECEPAYTLATALSLLAFFVYSLQCVSTIAVIRRETAGWKWPAFAFGYMLALAYAGSFVVYHGARALGW